jgi:hypothetical protein
MSNPLSSDRYWVIAGRDLAVFIDVINKFLIHHPDWQLLGGVSCSPSQEFAQAFIRQD